MPLRGSIVRFPVYAVWYGIVGCGMRVYAYALMIRADGVLVGFAAAMQASCDVNCIESDNHSAIYVIFMFDTVNAMMNYASMVTSQVVSSFAMAALGSIGHLC